ncbi:FtsX-like permease family protein [Actinocorallia longicatena]|uniref:FtsX-like permease family protein n=1 Tax=Actinocorallia longicatena TaxID=111803 RepID=A0ABP6PYM4_9ACTN
MRGGTSLRLQLVRIGWAAGRGRPGDRLRFWALALASSVLAATLLACVVCAAAYSGRDERDRARGFAWPLKGQKTVLLWQEAQDSLGEISHSVVRVVPLNPELAPPPGLDRWPEPGEAFLSPELVRLGGEDGVRERYGRFGGLIGDAGLASPVERLAYVRPAVAPDPAHAQSWIRAAGYGVASPFGESVYARPLFQLLLTLGATAGLAAMALLVIAARCGSATRDRRGGLLAALGASRGHRALVDIGESALPAAVGTLAGTLPVLVMAWMPIRLPITGYIVDPVYVRAWAVQLALTTVAAFLAVLAVVVLLHRVDGSGRSTRPREFTERVPSWRLYLCGLMISMIVAASLASGRLGLMLFVAGTVGTWATLPSVAAVLSQRLGKFLGGWGRRSGSSGLLIGGRWTTSHPGVVVRLGMAFVIGLGVVSQMQLWNSRLGGGAAEARQTNARIGDSVIMIEARGLTPERVAAFRDGLPSELSVFAIGRTSSRAGERYTLSAGCKDMKGLGLPCSPALTGLPRSAPDRRVDAMRRWFGGDTRMRTVNAVPARPAALVVVGPLGGPSPMAAVKQAGYRELSALQVGGLGEGWLIGAADRARLTNWLLLFGWTGLFFLLLAGGLSAAAEFLRFGPALAPLSVVSGRRRIFGEVAFWHLTVPTALAVLLAAAFTIWHGLFFVSVTGEGSLSWITLVEAVLVALPVTLLIGLLGGVQAMVAARRWRPVAD